MPRSAADHVEQPLAEEVGLEAARPAIGADRRLVGHPQRGVDRDVGDRVGPRHELGDVARADRAVGAHVGAHVDVGVAAQAEDDAVAAAGDLDIDLRFAGVVHRHQVLAAVLDPLHRPPDMARGERNEEVLRVELAARAEAAADVVLHHVDGVLGKADLLCQDAPVEERHLGRARDGEPAVGRVPLRQHAARLHGEAVMALGAELLAPDVGRRRERRVGIAAGGGERHRAVGTLAPRTAAGRRAPPRRNPVTGGSGSMSTAMCSSASSPIAALSASTTAIGSPT